MEFDEVDQKARDILVANDRGGFTVPTAGLYPFQWNWDSIFAAWGFAQFDISRAWEEIERLFEGQWPSGMVPHIIFRRPDPDYFPGPDVWGCDAASILTSGITQPPVAATFIRKIYEMSPELGKARIERLVPKIERWHKWFMEWRTSDEGAVFVTHPWESGRDNSPDWDTAMAALRPGDVGPYTRRDTSHVDASMRPTKEDYDRYIFLVQRGRRLGWDDAAMAKDQPFAVADPGMSFILLRANLDLAHLAGLLGRDTREIDDWTDKLTEGCKSLWNDEIKGFDAFDLCNKSRAGVLSSASFLCWYAGISDPQMARHLERILKDVPWPMPSSDPADHRFDALRYWRGPTWGIVNTMIGLGLAECGPEGTGETLRARTEAMISRNGFAEYFDPIRGTPAGGASFTWTAAIWLAWVRADKNGA